MQSMGDGCFDSVPSQKVVSATEIHVQRLLPTRTFPSQMSHNLMEQIDTSGLSAMTA